MARTEAGGGRRNNISQAMKDEVELDRFTNEIPNPDRPVDEVLEPGTDVLDDSGTGEEGPGGLRWRKQVGRDTGTLAAAIPMTNLQRAVPTNVEEVPAIEQAEDDLSQAYVQRVQARESDVLLNDFMDRTAGGGTQSSPSGAAEPPPAMPAAPPVPFAESSRRLPGGAGLVYDALQGMRPAGEFNPDIPWHQQRSVPEVFSAVWNSMKDIPIRAESSWVTAPLKDITKGLFWESPRWAARGVTTAAREFLVATADFDGWINTVTMAMPGGPMGGPARALRAGVQALTPESVRQEQAEFQRTLSAMLPKADDLLNKPETVTGHFGEEIVRFLVGWLPMMRAVHGITAARGVSATFGAGIGPLTPQQTTNLGRLNYWTGIAGAGAVAEGLTHPADEPNIANLIQAAPALQNVFTEYLAQDPNSSIALNKLRHAITDGFIAGTLADGLILAVRMMANKQRVIPEIDAQIRLHGEAGEGTLLAGTSDQPLISSGAPPPRNPFVIDMSTPEARANTENQLRTLLESGESGGVRVEAQTVFEDAFEQLKAAGRSDQEARTQAAIVAQRYGIMAERMGTEINADEFYRSVGLTINGPDAAVRRPVADITAAPPTVLAQQPAELPIHLRELIDSTPAIKDDPVRHFNDLEELLRRRADPEEIEKHPIVQAAYARGLSVPQTTDHPNFGTTEWMANREFNINGQQVRGYQAAQDHLYDLFVSKSTEGPVLRERRAIIVTGPGGAGKSTLMDPLARDTRSAIIDVDEAKALFPEYDRGIGTNAVHEESSFITFAPNGPFERLARDGSNMLIQKIGHGEESLRALTERLRRLGYSVSTINAVVDPAEAFRRRIGRFIRTGRINSSGYSHMLRENGDQPATTHAKLTKEGLYDESVQVDLNARQAQIIGGGDTDLARALSKYIQESPGHGQRYSIGQIPPGFLGSADSGARAVDPERLARAQRLGFTVNAYHGTDAAGEFSQFRINPNEFGIHFGSSPGQSNHRLAQRAATGSPEVFPSAGYGENARIIPVALKIQNPLRIDDWAVFRRDAGGRLFGKASISPDDIIEKLIATGQFKKADFQGANSHEQIIKVIESKGYDGIVYRDVGDRAGGENFTGYRPEIAERLNKLEARRNELLEMETSPKGEFAKVNAEINRLNRNERSRNKRGLDKTPVEDSYIVFHPNQIRSVHAEFDPALAASDNVFHQSAPAFYSSAERAIQMMPEAEAPGNKWLGRIRNSLGSGPNRARIDEELKWIGLESYLKERGNKKVTRDELVEYVAAHKVELKQVVKRGGSIIKDLREMTDTIYRQWLDNPEVLKNITFQEIPGNPHSLYIIDGNKNILDVTSYAQSTSTIANIFRAIRDNDNWFDLSRKAAENNLLSTDGYARYAGEQSLKLPGGSNYREFLIQLPQREGQPAFQTSHWGELNVIAHVRMNDRTIDGKRTLFLEEIQSDWHQQGRKQGYFGRKIPDSEIKEVDAIFDRIRETNPKFGVKVYNFGSGYDPLVVSKELLSSGTISKAEYEKIVSLAKAKRGGVPDAPFKDTWHELALKRMIRLAADEGYDAVAWTTGKQQADRYDLSKQVESISATRNADGTFDVRVREIGSTGTPTRLGNGKISERELANHVGKDIAEKIISSDGKITLSGVDLEIGGNFHKNLYDKKLVQAANDISTSNGGAKVERGTLQIDYPALQDKSGFFDFIEEPIHFLPLTPELQRVAKEQGFRLFQETGDGSRQGAQLGAGTESRGSINLGNNETIVNLFKGADASTFMHEMSHLWLHENMIYGSMPNAPPQIKQDLEITLRWLGVSDIRQVTREHHERWARTFEQYLATGEAPSNALKEAFERFKQWMFEIYRSITGTGGELSDEIRGVFDRMLASDPELAARGRRPILTEQGLDPALQPAVSRRLAEMGYDAITTKGIMGAGGQPGGPIVTRFDPSVSALGGKLAAASAATETGVPTHVAAQGISQSAQAAGIAKLVREADDSVASGPEIWVNFGRINAPEDVGQTIRDLADSMKGEINEARRGIQSNEETSRLADHMGMTVEDLMQRQKGQPFNAEQSLAARRLLVTSAEQLRMLADKAASMTSSLADQYNFRKMMAVHHSIQSEVIAARTETARALQAWSIPATGNVEMARDIASLIDSMGGSRTAIEMARMTSDLFKAGVPPGAINMMTRRGWDAAGMDALKEIYTLGLLWTPSTHVANVVSNTAVAFMQVYERGLAKLIGDMLDTPSGRVVGGETMAQLYGMMMSLRDAFQLSWKALKTGETGTSGVTGTKTDEPLGAIGSHIWSRERGHTLKQAEAYAASPLGRALDFIGTVGRMPGHALAAEDEFFKTIVWRGEVYAQSLRQATEEGLGSFSERWARMRELVNDPPEHIKIAAADAAAYATFQNQVGNVGKGLMTIRSGRLNPLFIVLPFVKTPTNILGYAFEHSPLAPLNLRWREDIAAGGGRRDLALAKMATGTTIIALALDYASNGYITGSGPSDQGQKEAWMRQGWQPNSIRIGDKYYSFNRFDPIGMLMGFSATVAESLQASDMTPERYDTASEIVAAMIATMSSSVVDKTYFTGVERMFRAIQSSERGDQGLQNFFNQQTGALLPFSSLFNFHRRWVDPVTREIHSPLDAIKSRIAAWSVGLMPARDLWGEIKRPQEVFGRAYDVLSPFGVSQRKDAPIDVELQRLNYGPRRIEFKTIFGGADVNFHDWPQVYDRYVELAGNGYKHPGYDNMGLRDFLNSVVSGNHPLSDHYRSLSDGREGSKAAWIGNRISEYRRAAQQQILTEEAERFPQFVAWVSARKAQRQEQKLPTELQGQGFYQQQ